MKKPDHLAPFGVPKINGCGQVFNAPGFDRLGCSIIYTLTKEQFEDFK